MLRWLCFLGLLSGAPRVLPAQHDSTWQVGRVAVWVRAPAGKVRGDILVLPGWDFPRDAWCQKTNWCVAALAAGYRLILPEMGKSVYASRYYPETRSDYRSRLTLSWVADTLLPHLQRYGLLRPGGRNYVLGLSTGARGAVLLTQRTDTLFRAVAALSGDYDQTLQPNDALMRNAYGPYAGFPARWTGEDNPVRQAERLHVPLYLAHGQQDAVVPSRHSQALAQAVRSRHPGVPVRLHLVPGAQHDWVFWGSQVPAVLAWFARYP